jgi:hypothetical protein
MSAVPLALVSASSIGAGAAVGFVLGFSVASHADVLRGVRPQTQNRLVLFLARPTSEFNFLEGVVFLGLMATWLGVFFALCALPALVAGRFGVEAEMLIPVGYGVFLVSGWLGRRFGAHVWKVIA